MDVGLLPVKRLDRAKGRLAEHFDAAARRTIADALFEDALTLCAESPRLTWCVISDDDTVLERAVSRGLGTVRDEGAGLNEAIGLGISRARADGAKSVSVVASDIPLA
ncbi:MAG: hypothetical protein M3345_01670, partial [Actinomycetota bacterium]|nr:hypothetical protein [Actinomycetota bacterium]